MGKVIDRKKGVKPSGRAASSHPESPLAPPPPNPRRRSPRPAGGKAGGLSPAGERIVAAFEEAIGAMRAGAPTPQGRRLTARTYRVDFASPNYGPADVLRVRELLAMSQVVFAQFLGVDTNTVRSWEQGTRPPSPMACRFLAEIEAEPRHWRRRIARQAVAGKVQDLPG